MKDPKFPLDVSAWVDCVCVPFDGLVTCSESCLSPTDCWAANQIQMEAVLGQTKVPVPTEFWIQSI